MICWFEDRLNGHRLVLDDLVERIGIARPEDVESGLKRIEQARAAGHWVALVIEYEFGQWLEPALAQSPGEPRERLTAWVFRQAQTVEIEASPDDNQPSGVIERAWATVARSQYIEMIETIRSLIAAGEVYQVNATFPIEVQTRGSPLSIYRQLAASSRARHCAYIEDHQNARTILSLSPELFVQRHGHRLITRPMKGTAPRIPDDATADQAMANRLVNSIKDRAENLMIVDLLRNDLGRIAVTGSVKVDPLFELEAYPSVWTMTSTIHADLLPDCSFTDVLRALFPCGSITGAPKIAAMNHIKQLESGTRGVYCGSLGWLAPNGDMSLNVAIRTLVIDQNSQGRYGVGSGIVYDSVPDQEWQECFWKARILGVDCETRPD